MKWLIRILIVVALVIVLTFVGVLFRAYQQGLRDGQAARDSQTETLQ